MVKTLVDEEKLNSHMVLLFPNRAQDMPLLLIK